MTHDRAMLLLIATLVFSPFLIGLAVMCSKEIDAFALEHQLALGWALFITGVYLAIRAGINYTNHNKVI
jgi:hypothetical protein